MSVPRLSAVLLSITFAACIPQGPNAGQDGYECRLGFNYWDGGACDEGLTCVDGTCISCGTDGDDCCVGESGDPYCDDGFVCDGDGPDSLGTCIPDTSSPSDPCLGGSTKYTLQVIDAGCGAHEVIFYTDTLAEAEACRDAYVNLAQPGEEICDLDEAPELANVCQFGSFGTSPMQLWNCSAAQLQSCEAYWCPDCTYTNGDCP